MSIAVRIHEHGGPDALKIETVDVGEPGAGEVKIRQTAVGLNFIDVYHRTGLYPVDLPATLGREAVGVVVAAGPGVDGVAEGDRVGYPLHPGAYCDERLVPAEVLVPIPDGIDDRVAAASLLKGFTAHYLLRKTYVVGPGDTVLIHAASGGVGSIACPWAAHLGATVIGTVGSEEKAERARKNGCAYVVQYREENFVERVREITDGRGVQVVYDSVGKDTFDGSLDCLAPRGMLVSFGQSSGPIPPLDLQVLSKKGSLFVTRPTLATYIADRGETCEAADELFRAIGSGIVSIDVGATYALRDVAGAHRDLEARKTVGSTVLLPS